MFQSENQTVFDGEFQFAVAKVSATRFHNTIVIAFKCLNFFTLRNLSGGRWTGGSRLFQ